MRTTVLLLLAQALAIHAALVAPHRGVSREVIAGAEVMWQVPENPKAVLLLAHAGARKITDYFARTPTCPECLGYPEEIAIMQSALRQGFTVVLPQSANTTWAGVTELDPEDASDVAKVILVMQTLHARLQWGDLPVYGLGICAGFKFLSVLALEYPMKAISGHLAILAPNEEACAWSYKCALLVGKPTKAGMVLLSAPTAQQLLSYPPTMMVSLSRDLWTADRVVEWKKHLEGMGVEVYVVDVHPTKVDAQLLRRKIPQLSAAAADDLMDRFLKHEMVDKDGNVMRQKTGAASSCENHLPNGWAWGLDPQPEKWKEGDYVYTKEGVGLHQIEQVLKMAHVCHEAISATTDATLDWFLRVAPVPSRPFATERRRRR